MAPYLDADPRVDTSQVSKELGWETVNSQGYEILERQLGVKAPKRVICVGAGATGICLAKFAQDAGGIDLEIYEKNAGVSGTWFENRYPGCRCDIPAHIYQFQWALNPNWSEYYAGRKEIYQYFNDVVDKHGLRKFIKLQHSVIGASWNSETAQWAVTVRRPDRSEFVDHCDFLINGSGLLNNWKWPDTKGLHNFKGTLAHSADFPEELDLTDKRVAVIGAGSSGIQIVAELQPKVKHLYTWVRSRLWISAGFASAYASPEGDNFKYGEELKKKFAADPVALRRYVKMLDDELGKRFFFNMSNSKESLEGIEFSRKVMEKKLQKKPELIDRLIPTNFAIGCRRPTPGNGYLEALVCDNVTVFPGEVREITPGGFIDHTGQEHEVDVIICATGFDVSYVPRFPITANGKDLRDLWKKDAVSYLSAMVPEFPNYFISLGPYSASNGSLLPPIEHGVKYFLKIIEKCQVERIRYLAPKQEATDQFREHADLLLKRTVWTQPCRSWFKGGTVDGLPRIYPSSRAHFIETMQPRYEDFDITYENRNRFWFWGNGFTTREVDGRDPTWYLGLINDEDKHIDFTEDMKEVLALSGLASTA